MIQVLGVWFRRYLSHPQAVLLLILLLLGFTVIFTLGKILAPMFAALVISFLLEGSVCGLTKSLKTPRLLSVWSVFMAFMALLMFILLIMLPLLSLQLSQFLQEVPNWIMTGHSLLLQLPERYPDFFSIEQVDRIITDARSKTNDFAQMLLSYSINSMPLLITFLVYLVLVPVMVFFFMKDKTLILGWLKGFLPAEHTAAQRIWDEMNKQMGNYVRGKFYEILIVGSGSYVAFTFMGLNYAPLLGALVGLSVVVPYIGAAVVTFPVVLVAYFQWGWGSDFLWLSAVYFIIQALDGNVLVPLLFSEAVNLHPVAIIMAVLVFGGLWGFWGVFFAIPLATLVKALLAAWPRLSIEEDNFSSLPAPLSKKL
ncbi:AI-2E family transporter [Candidatus Venteria ishoeyi]|uniref:AI-2E family transporter n=1 Tax=Candidatus Venteria ishoeyi TaxID=1899563 RepID=UPI0025A5F0D7|nr:AI-2E family transporter [Candidatus Venteria ishoeyi]MDM8545892.1 AI-2E family transporter [Candidatus Venteria ishoeyi]